MEFGEPPPKPNNLPSMHDLVMQDMAARKQFGLDKYKSLLQPFNGRDPLKDLYEEILDAAVYVRQAMWERDNPEQGTWSPTVRSKWDPSQNCYCGGPEEIYPHKFGTGRHCRGKVQGGK